MNGGGAKFPLPVREGEEPSCPVPQGGMDE